jgi:hypothetical protein
MKYCDIPVVVALATRSDPQEECGPRFDPIDMEGRLKLCKLMKRDRVDITLSYPIGSTPKTELLRCEPIFFAWFKRRIQNNS